MPNQTVTLSPAELRSTFRCFASGVTAVCGTVDGQPNGIIASSFTSVRLDPPMVSVCMDNSSSTWPALRTADRLGISVLGADQELLCRQLAAKGSDRFADVPVEVTPRGAVLISGAVAWFECRVAQEAPAGDHSIVLLEIEDMFGEPHMPPLIFHGSRFRQLELTA